MKDKRIKVMGNIPYNITGDILFKLLSEMDVVESAHLTMQKEVGERLASKPCSRSYGALSVIFQLYASVKMLLKLKPSLFIPPPAVESAFIGIIFNHGEAQADQGLIDFIKACFRYKRKYLKNSLEPLLGKERVQALYDFMDFQPSVRAEELQPQTFERMYAYVGDRAQGFGGSRGQGREKQ
jgi:16S rRNA (adenine1518-N6/adenine1519-N6)-dimethyltransferase